MAFKQNNPLSRKTSPINRDWIKGAIKRPGAFTKKANISLVIMKIQSKVILIMKILIIKILKNIKGLKESKKEIIKNF